ncbi:MAG: iron-containing alcohol dehydrogenase [Mogibacterium kristiansenii]|uniref:MATE family efflux transporter n=1 Tax=Mogibacterium kristiansenii TaxID=2606708 RepID=UPI003F06EBF4
MSNRRTFFYYVIPSVLSFALSGIYAIVDGFFVGNSIGDAGLSAINIAYPITAVLVATGTGIGMGGAVKYSILNAGGHEERARDYAAEAIWMMLLFSVLLAGSFYVLSERLLSALGAYGELLVLGKEYTTVIILGTVLQVFGTGMVPFMRNYGGAMWAMIAMMCGFATNVILDYILVWVLNRGMTGAAFADYGSHIIHGAANAMYLPKVIAYNAKNEEAKKRYAVIADYMHLGGTTEDEKVAALIEYVRGMNDKLNIPHCIKNYGGDSYPTEQGFVPEDVFLERLPEIAANAILDACTGSNPRQPSQEDMEELLKCCYYDTEVDF